MENLKIPIAFNDGVEKTIAVEKTIELHGVTCYVHKAQKSSRELNHYIISAFSRRRPGITETLGPAEAYAEAVTPREAERVAKKIIKKFSAARFRELVAPC